MSRVMPGLVQICVTPCLLPFIPFHPAKSYSPTSFIIYLFIIYHLSSYLYLSLCSHLSLSTQPSHTVPLRLSLIFFIIILLSAPIYPFPHHQVIYLFNHLYKFIIYLVIYIKLSAAIYPTPPSQTICLIVLSPSPHLL